MRNRQGSSDAWAVEQTLAGRRDAFGVLVQRHLPAVHAVAYARLGGRAEVDDVVQDTFLAAFQSLHTLRERGKFGAWLLGIARNVCSQAKRVALRDKALPEEAAPKEAVPPPDMARRELHSLLRRKVMELDETPREILLLYYFAGKKLPEIAESLDISFEAAAKRLQRARETLGNEVLDEVAPAIAPGQTDEERKKRIMAAILILPVPWTTPKPRPWHRRVSPESLQVAGGLAAVIVTLVAVRVIFQMADSAPATPLAGRVIGLPPGTRAGVIVVQGSFPDIVGTSRWDIRGERGLGTNLWPEPDGHFRTSGLHKGTYTVAAFVRGTGEWRGKAQTEPIIVAAVVEITRNAETYVELRVPPDFASELAVDGGPAPAATKSARGKGR